MYNFNIIRSKTSCAAKYVISEYNQLEQFEKQSHYFAQSFINIGFLHCHFVNSNYLNLLIDNLTAKQLNNKIAFHCQSSYQIGDKK